MAVLKAHIENRPGRKLTLAAICLAVWSLTAAMLPVVQAPVSKEYQVKAVFLYNFTQFVEWPAASFADAKSPIVIGILGSNPFGNYLIDAIKGEKVNGRVLVVKYYRNADDIGTCHMLFVAERAAERSSQVMRILRDRSILTVGDTPEFIQQGGMIRFFTENGKMRIQINPEIAKAANLNLSSNLLRLADIKK